MRRSISYEHLKYLEEKMRQAIDEVGMRVYNHDKIIIQFPAYLCPLLFEITQRHFTPGMPSSYPQTGVFTEYLGAKYQPGYENAIIIFHQDCIINGDPGLVIKIAIEDKEVSMAETPYMIDTRKRRDKY